MILTQAQRRAFERGIAAANDVLPQIEYLERIAAAAPHIAERVQELRTRRDYLHSFCETCVAMDRVETQT